MVGCHLNPIEISSNYDIYLSTILEIVCFSKLYANGTRYIVKILQSVAERKSEMGNLAVRLRDELYINGCRHIWLERNWKNVRVSFQQLQQDGKENKV